MTIQIDIWGGDLHQSLVREYFPDTWSEAAQIIEREVEAGNLANVLHTDFKCPEQRHDELASLMRDLALKGGDA